jgi:CHRD domain
MGGRERGLPARLAGAALALGLVVATVPAAAVATVTDPNTLVASLNGENIPSDGDPGGSGTFSIALDPSLGQGCFVLDIALTDLAGDPPTAIDVHDYTTGDPESVTLALASDVDGAGHAEGCLAVPANLVETMFETPNRYYVDVHTAGYSGGAVRGWIEYSYPTGELSVHTRVCPASIQSVGQLTESAKESCLVVVLPADDIAGYLPGGYTANGYGGTATFDYHVTDGKHLDATIAGAIRGGGGACSDVTRTCDMSWLPYVWTAGMGEIHVTPTLFPSGTRFGTADAMDGLEPGDPIPLSIGAGNVVTVDATGKVAVAVFVYLFRTTDTTAPTVSAPKVSLRAGATFGPRAPVQLAWSGSDAESGIDHYAVERRLDGGSWTTIAASVLGTSYDTSMAPGHSYLYRIRAYDCAGNARPSAATARHSPRVAQDSAASVRYRGTWQRKLTTSASGGSLRYATARGATARLTFAGRSIAWVAPRGLSRGSARVYLDGAYFTTVSLHGAAANREVVFSKRFSGLATHTIEVRVVGTAGHPRVDVDAFLYLN